MNKKIVLLIFFSFFVFFLNIAQVVVESKRFASWVDKNLLSPIVEKNNVSFAFDHLDLDVLEGKLMFTKSKLSFGDIHIEGDIGFGSNLDFLLSRKLVISNLIVANAEVLIPLPESSSSKRKLNMNNFIKKIEIELRKNSVKKIRVLDTKLIGFKKAAKPLNVEISELVFDIANKNKSRLKLDVKNSSLGELFLDGLSLSLDHKNDEITLENMRVLKGVSSIWTTEPIKLKNGNISAGNINFELIAEDLPKSFTRKLGVFSHLLKRTRMRGDLNLSIVDEEMKGRGRFESLDLEGTKVYKKLSSSFSLNNKVLTLRKIEFFDYDAGSITSDKLEIVFGDKVSVEKTIFKINNFRIDESGDFIKNLTGVAIRGFFQGDVEFIKKDEVILSSKNFNITNLCLKTLSLDSIICTMPVEGSFLINNDKITKLKYDLKINDEKFQGDGKFSGDEILVRLENYSIKPTTFFNIFGLDLAPLGKIKVKYKSIKDKIGKLFIYSNFDSITVEKIDLGKLKADFYYDFNEKKLVFLRANGKVGNSIYTGSGFFDFWNRPLINISLDFSSFNISDLNKIIPGYLGPVRKYISLVNSNSSANIKIEGPLTKSGISLMGSVVGSEINFIKEDFSRFNAVVGLKNGELLISPFQVRKGANVLSGSSTIDLAKGKVRTRLRSKKLKLSDFHYYRLLGSGVRGQLSLDFNMTDLENYSLVGNISNAKIGLNKAGDSSFILISKSKMKELAFDFFSGTFSANTTLVDTPEGSKYEINSKINVDKLENYINVISSDNKSNINLSGQVNMSLKSKGIIEKPNQIDLKLDVRDFFISRDDLNLTLRYPDNYIEIKKGKVLKNKIIFGGDNQYLNLAASKNGGTVLLKADYKIPGSFLELFPQVVSSYYGLLEGHLHYQPFVANSINAALTSKKSEIKLRHLPTPLHNVGFELFFNNNVLDIINLNAGVGGGEVGVNGLLTFGNTFPKVDLSYQLSSAKISLLDASSFNVSGFGKVFGSNVPYFLNGSLKIIDGKVEDDPKTFFDLKKRFKGSRSKQGNLLDFKIDVSSIGGISLKNSLTDLLLNLKLRVQGGENSLKTAGEIIVDNNKSKIFFKGHDFKITKGNVFFRESSSSLDPYFDIISETKISNYNLEMEINGDVKNLSVSFRSDPPLAENDILSLLTLGITLDTSRELQDAELESVTSMSLGSLLIDQFGINQGLNESLGIKVSVSPEFSNDNINPIAGKISSSSDTARLRSATKLRLSKRISNSIDLNYSSTLGGSLDQSQQMNIDFRINEDFSLQGVYRTQTNETSENIDNTESVGFDLIWKRTFK